LSPSSGGLGRFSEGRAGDHKLKKEINMNWGYKITLVIILFIVAMVSMVAIAFKQTNDMVDTNYYDKEINYQSLIDAANNLNKVCNDTLLRQDINHVTLQIPRPLLSGFGKGRLEFLKTDDKAKDRIIPFTPDSNGLFVIDKTENFTGIYKARIQWNSESKMYYREQDILLQ
jgi:hypothetical protein